MKVSYYPGCSLHATGKEYDESMKAVSGALDITLQEVDDWVCCGASSAHMTNYKLSVALPARSIIAAEKENLDVMVPCAACFNRFKMAQHHLRHDDALKAEVEGIVGDTYQDSVAVRNPIDIIYTDIGLETIEAKVTRKLTGLKPVSYYGCLLLRPPEVCEFENYENPYMMDAILKALGAEPRKWSCGTDCCGGSLSIGKTEIVVHLCNKLMRMAREADANCLVTACPLCMANLDMRATEGLPVFYFTELMALAMGLDGPNKWFKLHNVNPLPLMQSLGLQ
ncbi:MAG: CoB--CoM heterodisulfide reductase iron-sulfur subunit B family protein [Deltaproteobacteria bacterium]|nr:CoB--CoM heterodisulfide reductase iron-sulfur subunit B family protein [Deltaproteobacteria bacterium]MBN2687215.1 CoB--CoM heterodisulfide reductase iron-sulfur subunit B family protein [Deltaproteobacteria bacterium]